VTADAAPVSASLPESRSSAETQSFAASQSSTLPVAMKTGADLTLPKLGPAPSWRLEDLAGRSVTSEQFKGKVVVVDFWATWCPPCRAEIPGYTQLQEKYGKDGFMIVGISLDQAGPDVVKRFAEQ